jgi:hypothetical protein
MNDEGQMMKDSGQADIVASAFVIRPSFVIRHLTFVIANKERPGHGRQRQG